MSALLGHALTGAEGRQVLALAPSMGTSTSLWDPQLAGLEVRFRVLRFDHRGHGGSEVTPGPYRIEELGGDVLALLDRLGLDRICYAGISLGAMVGLWLAANAGDRLERLVVISGLPRVGDAQGYRERAARVRREGMEAIAAEVAEHWFSPGFRERAPEAVTGFGRELALAPAEGYAACCEALAAADLGPLVAAVRTPTLVLAGDCDPFVRTVDAEALARSLPRARCAIVVGAGHLLTVEQPELVTRLMVEHLCDAAGQPPVAREA